MNINLIEVCFFFLMAGGLGALGMLARAVVRGEKPPAVASGPASRFLKLGHNFVNKDFISHVEVVRSPGKGAFLKVSLVGGPPGNFGGGAYAHEPDGKAMMEALGLPPVDVGAGPDR